MADYPREGSNGDMVPLSDAAYAAYEAATGAGTDKPSQLNELARLISKRTSVFTRPNLAAEYVMVAPDEIEEGVFQEGGAYLEFSDARQPLLNLAIMRKVLPKLVADIRELMKRADDLVGGAAP
jgi:hypothetical protein